MDSEDTCLIPSSAKELPSKLHTTCELLAGKKITSKKSEQKFENTLFKTCYANSQ